MKNELMTKIAELEKQIFLESMADFMNWDRYHKLNRELAELKKELEN